MYGVEPPQRLPLGLTRINPGFDTRWGPPRSYQQLRRHRHFGQHLPRGFLATHSVSHGRLLIVSCNACTLGMAHAGSLHIGPSSLHPRGGSAWPLRFDTTGRSVRPTDMFTNTSAKSKTQRSPLRFFGNTWELPIRQAMRLLNLPHNGGLSRARAHKQLDCQRRPCCLPKAVRSD